MKRRAARGLVIDEMNNVLLLHARDPFAPSVLPWWELPGGGIDSGETSADAARREVREETGLLDVEVGPCVWERETVFTFAGMTFDQHERIHLVRCRGVAPDIRPSGLEALEAIAFQGSRWWTLADILTADAEGERFFPTRLAEHLGAVLRGAIGESPVRLGD